MANSRSGKSCSTPRTSKLEIMRSSTVKNNSGFSLLELLLVTAVMLIALGIVSTIMARSFSVRARESQTTDALVSAQAALNVLSREIANSGFGLYSDPTTKVADNGIVTADSGLNKIRVRANLDNSGGTPTTPGPQTLVINSPGEDVTYFFDSATKSIVRYDANALGVGSGETSVVVNRISNVTFQYFDYAGATATVSGPFNAPTANTGRVQITVAVTLDPVAGQPNPQTVTFTSEITLRNNEYMLQQY
jgi:prepilin-type N-terminal cleavage/methylation domain-containing protein